ncbi:MAG: ABC transporter permease, partial [Gammaproteobacteria bacterium]
PGPAAVWSEAGNLMEEHYKEREKELAFYERQQKRNAEILAKQPGADVKIRPYTGKPTYVDQIFTSLWTVFTGFFLAAVIAIPMGVLCGLSTTVNTALNPFIQIFKPVSPLAWLPIVTLVISASYEVTDTSWFQKAFLTSAITVSLCSLWPALINTAVGVASIDKDLMNVARVLHLGWFRTVTKIVLPSALPLIFTGLRLSLGVGWMVLIASEMLAQNPGLGKFVWDEFQNGSSQSLGRIMVAVFTIGLIGFLLDRIMMTLQKLFSFGKTV